MNSTVVSRATATERAVAAVLVSAELCISIIGNLLVLFVSLWDEHVKQHRSNLLVISLAVTDLLTATLVMLPSVCALTNEGWPLDNPGFCTFHGILNYWLTSTSSVTLAMIALDRGVAIHKPLQYVQHCTWRRLVQMVALPWTLGIIFAVVPAILDWTAYQFDNIVCDVDWHPRREHVIYYAATFSLCFAAPAAIVLVQYARILASVRRLRTNAIVNPPVVVVPKGGSASNGMLSRQPSFRRRQGQGNQKILVSILAVIVIFFICITPFCCTKLVKVLLGPKAIPDWLDMLSTVVQFLASVVNPFVYSIGLKSFHEALCRLSRSGRHRLLWSTSV